MKKNAKLAALAILVLAAVAALSVGITLAVVNARMPAACTCSGQCRSAGTETAAAGVGRMSAQQRGSTENGYRQRRRFARLRCRACRGQWNGPGGVWFFCWFLHLTSDGICV